MNSTVISTYWKRIAASASWLLEKDSSQRAWLRRITFLCAWYYIFAMTNYDQIFFMVSCIVAIFCNLGNRTDGYSAYSVFNDGCRHLLGDLRADQVDREYRGLGHVQDDGRAVDSNIVRYEGEDEDVVPWQEYVKSRDVNKKCFCGSGRKFKVCHMKNPTGKGM